MPLCAIVPIKESFSILITEVIKQTKNPSKSNNGITSHSFNTVLTLSTFFHNLNHAHAIASCLTLCLLASVREPFPVAMPDTVLG